jgi:hypothetical protein
MEESKEEMFWKLVDKLSEQKCWLWKGYTVNGYGRFSGKGVNRPAHRFSWFLANGPIPKELGGRKLVIRHLCGNRLCVNPLHLKLGTYSDNNRDRYAVNNYTALIFSIDEIREIWARRKNGESYSAIGHIMNHHQAAIRYVALRKGVYANIKSD